MLILNPTEYSDSANGISVGIPSNSYPSAFKIKNVANTFPLFIPSASGGSNSTYSTDCWYFNTSNAAIATGGGNSQNLDYGLFFFNHYSASSTNSSIGARPMKFP